MSPYRQPPRRGYFLMICTGVIITGAAILAMIGAGWLALRDAL